MESKKKVELMLLRTQPMLKSLRKEHKSSSNAELPKYKQVILRQFCTLYWIWFLWLPTNYWNKYATNWLLWSCPSYQVTWRYWFKCFELVYLGLPGFALFSSLSVMTDRWMSGMLHPVWKIGNSPPFHYETIVRNPFQQKPKLRYGRHSNLTMVKKIKNQESQEKLRDLHASVDLIRKEWREK